MAAARKVLHVLFCLLSCVCIGSSASRHSIATDDEPKQVVSMTFLVTVNLTYGECLQTVKTPPLKPNQTYNASKIIYVGNCDHGPLTYTITHDPTEENGRKVTHTYIQPTFYTGVIAASPPTCKILWDYEYQEPKSQNPHESLLPGCWLSDSQEGWHNTYYWFHILDWVIA